MNEETGGTYQGTDFKQYPHEQLLQMFTRENFQQVGDAAARLAELSGRMTAAAVRLRRYTESLGPEDWDGDARLSFDQWTQGLINTTFTVADGVGEIGEAVQVVADKM
ncbi:MAG: hypothetical protein HOV68_25180, partial [Streptomycetaceae bacterium]|nr:hypothetical protein [Streptomycetaceae bacterium]